MEKFEFDFERINYLFFIIIEKQIIKIGIIEIKKEEIANLSENEEESFLNNIFSLDYNVLYKMEKKINPRMLTRIVKFINKSIYYYCDTKVRKDLLFQNLKKIKTDINIVWKIKL